MLPDTNPATLGSKIWEMLLVGCSPPDSKVHVANMGPTCVLADPGGPMLAPWTLLSRPIHRGCGLLRGVRMVAEWLGNGWCLVQIGVCHQLLFPNERIKCVFCLLHWTVRNIGIYFSSLRWLELLKSFPCRILWHIYSIWSLSRLLIIWLCKWSWYWPSSPGIFWFVHMEAWIAQIARFMGPIWGPPGSCRPQLGPMWASLSLLSGYITISWYPLHTVSCVSLIIHNIFLNFRWVSI